MSDIDDKIDWKIVDQLHNSVSAFSSTSLELKKMLLVLIGIAIPSLIKLSDDHLNLALFVAIYVLSTTFWALDALTYFYQEKLREKMEATFLRISQRNGASSRIVGSDGLVIERNRKSNGRLMRSFLNWSSAIYPSIIIFAIFGHVLYLLKVIS